MKRAIIVLFVTFILTTALFSICALADTGNSNILEQQKFSKVYTNLYKGKQVNWTWTVDNYDLDFWIEDPTTAKYYQSASLSTDTGSFVVPQTGIWTFWWENTYVPTASEDYSVYMTYYINFTNKAPVANITTNRTSGYAPLGVTFSANGIDTDGIISAWSWNFGDSTSSTQRNTTHMFNNPGKYLVVLTVTDNDGATGKKNVTINVSAVPNKNPTASIGADIASGIAPLKVTFTGTGTDSDGNIVSYAWVFGDGGTSNLKNPVHTYQNPGTYSANLTVTDDDAAIGKATVAITVLPVPNIPPVATIKVDKNTGNAPLAVNFTGGGTDTDGKIVKWNWSFGDKGYSSKQNQSHTFSVAKTYQVVLTITDDDGANATKTVNITVNPRVNKLPTVTIKADKTTGIAPLLVAFSSAAIDPDGTITSYAWTFGDGGKSTKQNESHTFASPGTYTVKLIVLDNDKANASASMDIVVTAAPGADNDKDKDGMPDGGVQEPDEREQHGHGFGWHARWLGGLQQARPHQQRR